MAIFTMSDLHLSLGVDKPMEVFGSAWDNYMERIRLNWNEVVGEGDVVFIGGDISWAMRLSECYKDFEYLNALNGAKVLLKGNHDYWWESVSKMNKYLDENGFHTMSFLQNNAFLADDVLVCGSRGWLLPGDGSFSEDDNKIYQRELQRLELSFSDGERLLKESGREVRKRVCLLHYPPFTRRGEADEGLASVMEKYAVTDCIYGHLHARAARCAREGTFGTVAFKLVSADYMDFCPYRL